MNALLKKTGRLLGVAAVFFVLSLVYLWPLPLTGNVELIGGNGDPLLELWTLCWNDHWFSGEAPSYFDANICHPEKNSLAFADHLFSQSLIFIPLYRVTGNPVLSYNLLLVLALALSGWGAYLCAGTLGLSRPVSLVVGVLFAFFPFRISQISHLHILSTQWLPFSFYFLLGFLRSKSISWRHLSLFALFSLLHSLCSFYQALIWALLISITVVAFMIGGRIGWRKMVGLLCAGLVIAAVLAPFASAYFQVSGHYKIVRSINENSKFSARLVDFVHASHSSLLYRHFMSLTNIEPPPTYRTGEHQLYPGLVFIILLAGGTVAIARPEGPMWRRNKVLPNAAGNRMAQQGEEPPDTPAVSSAQQESRLVWLALLATTLAAIIFAFGPTFRWGSGDESTVLPLPYSLLYHWLPGIKGLRVPSRLVILFHFSGALLAGLGLQTMLSGRIKQVRGLAWTAAIFLSGLIIFESVSFDLPVKALPLPRSMPASYQDICQMPEDTVLLELPTHEKYHQYLPMYTSSFHFHSLANGRSGIIPPVTAKMYLLTNPANPYALGPALLEHMLDTGINTVLLHRSWNSRRTNQVTLNRIYGLDCFKVVGRYDNLDILLRLAAKKGLENDVTVLDGVPMASLSGKRIPLKAANAYPPTQNRALQMEVRGDTLHLGERIYFCWLVRLTRGNWQLRFRASGLDHPNNGGQPVVLWAKIAGHQVLEAKTIEHAENIKATPVEVAETGYYRISAFVRASQPGAPLNLDLDSVRLVPLARAEAEPVDTVAENRKQSGGESRKIP